MGGFYKKTIKDVNLKGKTVLLRADYNVPLNDSGQIVDDYRLQMSLPTLEYLLKNNCKIIVMSHLGRPEGRDETYSLRPVAIALRAMLSKADVQFVNDAVTPELKNTLKSRKKGTITLLENVRFDSREESNDGSYAEQLASLADIFVQDAFGVVHRRHVTVTGLAELLPSYAGLLVEREYDVILGAIEKPKQPMVAVVGGAKISDKIKVLKRFVQKADAVAVVGAMANTFLLARGIGVGKSLAEPDQVELAKEIMALADTRAKDGFQFYIPKDYVVSTSLEGDMPTRIVDIDTHFTADVTAYPKQPSADTHTVGDAELILDIGPASAGYIAGMIGVAKTAVWSGTAGVAEVSGMGGAAAPFAHGSHALAKAMQGTYASAAKPFVVAGGGDTTAFIESIPGLRDSLGHVSTGGSTSLELMSGAKLVGVECLKDKD